MHADATYSYVRDLVERLTGIRPNPDHDGDLPELLTRLNQINGEIQFARTCHVRSQVLFESEIWADDVNPANFKHACMNIAGATDHYARRLQQEFGGHLQFEETNAANYSSNVTEGSPYL